MEVASCDAHDDRIAQLEDESASLRARAVELEASNAAFAARLTDIEERIGRTPRNSSMPPSKEGLSKPPARKRAERPAEQRRQG
jgi:hypothetical protein